MSLRRSTGGGGGGFGGGVFPEEVEEVFGVEDADDVVEGAFEDGDAGEAFLEDFACDFGEGGGDFEGA